MKGHILFFKIVIISLLIFSIPSQSNAQFYEFVDYVRRAASARNHIDQLHEGTLVVRLRSKRNNLEAMEKALASDNLNEKQRKRLNKQMSNMISHNQKENQEIVAALNKHYTFSDYRIVSDSSIYQLFAKKDKGYFLNNKLEIDPKISINFSKPVYVLIYDHTDMSENSRLEGLIITDLERNHLKTPFPYLQKNIWPPLAVLNFFVGDSNLSPRFRRMIENTNASLNRFYINSQIKLEKDKLKKQLKDLKD